MDATETKKLNLLVTLLKPLPLAIGLGASYLVSGKIEMEIMAPVIAGGYLLIGAWLFFKKQKKPSK